MFSLPMGLFWGAWCIETRCSPGVQGMRGVLRYTGFTDCDPAITGESSEERRVLGCAQ